MVRWFSAPTGSFPLRPFVAAQPRGNPPVTSRADHRDQEKVSSFIYHIIENHTITGNIMLYHGNMMIYHGNMMVYHGNMMVYHGSKMMYLIESIHGFNDHDIMIILSYDYLL